ncbi:MAG TPA: 6-phosphogluconolactonase [Candidatus Limnocylindria bacterium]|nr:6-phosphogluconolactonase [Candidatus Limnocylindria bacterium]
MATTVSGEPEVRVFDDAEGASRAAAEVIAGALRDAVAERGRADWATTGGSTPAGVYRWLAEAPLRDEVPWDRVHVWWGDDRFVPRDHPLSNVLPLDSVLISSAARAGLSGAGADAVEVDLGIEPGAPIPVANIHAPNMTHAIATSAGVDWVAADYDRELHAAGLATDQRGFPVFDVMFLGIGPDGHLLSAFPGSALFDTEAWVSAVPAPTHVEPHVARMSLNPAVVAGARLPVVVATGDGKAAILASVLGAAGEDRDERHLPSLVARRPGAIWFLDRAAAASIVR